MHLKQGRYVISTEGMSEDVGCNGEHEVTSDGTYSTDAMRLEQGPEHEVE